MKPWASYPSAGGYIGRGGQRLPTEEEALEKYLIMGGAKPGPELTERVQKLLREHPEILNK